MNNERIKEKVIIKIISQILSQPERGIIEEIWYYMGEKVCIPIYVRVEQEIKKQVKNQIKF